MEDVKSESAATSVIRSAKSSDSIRIAKSSRPEIVRAHFERNAVGGLVRGENPPRFVRSSAQANEPRVFVLSFPLFRLSRSDNLPRRRVLRTRREAHFAPLITTVCRGPGDVAQLGEHLLCKQGVSGSSPLISTSTLTTE